MPYQEEIDRQPLRPQIPKRNNRYWDFKPASAQEKDRRSGLVIPARTLNRPLQRNHISRVVAVSLAATKAASEGSSWQIAYNRQCADLYMEIQLRSATGNNYTLFLDFPEAGGPDPEWICTCPGYWRNKKSYPLSAPFCKHMIYVRNLYDANTLFNFASCDYVAWRCDVAPATAQRWCRENLLAATKVNEVWLIDPLIAETFISDFIAENGGGNDCLSGVKDSTELRILREGGIII